MFVVFVVVALVGLIITVHEYGHFLAMRFHRIAVEEFSIGMGPSLFRFPMKRGGTFHVRALLIGGYVKAQEHRMLSCDLAHESDRGADACEHPSHEEYSTNDVEVRGAWVRFQVYAAGMLMNVLTAVAVITAIRIARLEAFSIAGAGAALVSSCETGFAGWLFAPVQIVSAFMREGADAVRHFAGPVGIFHYAGKLLSATESGSQMLLAFGNLFATLSIGVAAGNLLPLVPLDGGKIAQLAFEKIVGRSGRGVQIAFAAVGVLAALTLVVLVTVKDIGKLL